jgi:hypothetical protein
LANTPPNTQRLGRRLAQLLDLIPRLSLVEATLLDKGFDQALLQATPTRFYRQLLELSPERTDRVLEVLGKLAPSVDNDSNRKWLGNRKWLEDVRSETFRRQDYEMAKTLEPIQLAETCRTWAGSLLQRAPVSPRAQELLAEALALGDRLPGELRAQLLHLEGQALARLDQIAEAGSKRRSR